MENPRMSIMESVLFRLTRDSRPGETHRPTDSYEMNVLAGDNEEIRATPKLQQAANR